MALDTKPLNRSRKALLLLFMLVLFLGSLGVAQMIVKERVKGVAKGFYFDIPAGFESFQVLPQTAHQPVFACGNEKLGREFIVFQLPVHHQQIDLFAHANLLYRTYLHAIPKTPSELTINKNSAVRLTGPVGPGFGMIVAMVVDGRFVAVLYHGNSAPAQQDELLFRKLTEESIIFFGSAK